MNHENYPSHSRIAFEQPIDVHAGYSHLGGNRGRSQAGRGKLADALHRYRGFPPLIDFHVGSALCSFDTDPLSAVEEDSR